MIGYLIKVFSFFIKEFHDVRRQPRLMISLVGGPLLVLAAFGATFRSANPFVTVVLVWPENGIPGISQEQAAQLINSNFRLIAVTSDKERALQLLDQNLVDVVEVVPEIKSVAERLGERPEIQIFSKAIDPNKEAWVRAISYAQMNTINQQLLAQEAGLAQDKAREVNINLDTARGEFELVKANLKPEEIKRVVGLVQGLRSLLIGLIKYLPPESVASASLAPELSHVQRDVNILLDDLDELEKTLQPGNLAASADRLSSVIEEIMNLQGTIKVFVAIPAEAIISPVRETYTNLRGNPFSLVIFYAPAVLALLIQQLAVTLASLGLVRERQMGAFEMFRASPLRLSQILLGKSLAYILYATIAGIILTILLALLNVPGPAYMGEYLILLLLLSTAAVGVGTLISAVSRTDSQAIQLTMLVLLLSVFFTGFFLPIMGFTWPAWIIALLIPMTYAVEGLQSLMLAGSSISPLIWIGLGVITLLSYGLVLLIMQRQYRKVLD
jgi:ABC-2 type transport system permease protein